MIERSGTPARCHKLLHQLELHVSYRLRTYQKSGLNASELEWLLENNCCDPAVWKSQLRKLANRKPRNLNVQSVRTNQKSINLGGDSLTKLLVPVGGQVRCGTLIMVCQATRHVESNWSLPWRWTEADHYWSPSITSALVVCCFGKDYMLLGGIPRLIPLESQWEITNHQPTTRWGCILQDSKTYQITSINIFPFLYQCIYIIYTISWMHLSLTSSCSHFHEMKHGVSIVCTYTLNANTTYSSEDTVRENQCALLFMSLKNTQYTINDPLYPKLHHRGAWSECA